MTDNWETYACDMDGRPAVVIVNLGPAARAPQKSRPWYVAVRMKFRSPDEMPDEKELQVLGGIRDELETALRAGGKAVWVVQYRIGHHQTGEPFENNGAVGVLPGSDVLASSIFPLEHMVRVMVRDTDAGLAQVIRMASLTPAERLQVLQNYVDSIVSIRNANERR